MTRKLSNKNVEIIKVMLSKDYKPSSIIDIMKIKHNVILSSYDIKNIMTGISYFDIRQDLNNTISKNFVCKNVDERQISEIKWALAQGYTKSEICATYKITSNKLMRIRLGYAPFCLIAPEFNDLISSLCGKRKKVNVDKTIVLSVKNQYVINNGDITCAELAKKYNIDKATVSNMLSFKAYSEFGKSYNLQISRIKAKANKLKIAKIELAKKRKIEAEKQKIQLYISQFDALSAKMDKSRKLVQSLKSV